MHNANAKCIVNAFSKCCNDALTLIQTLMYLMCSDLKPDYLTCVRDTHANELEFMCFSYLTIISCPICNNQ